MKHIAVTGQVICYYCEPFTAPLHGVKFTVFNLAKLKIHRLTEAVGSSNLELAEISLKLVIQQVCTRIER